MEQATKRAVPMQVGSRVYIMNQMYRWLGGRGPHIVVSRWYSDTGRPVATLACPGRTPISVPVEYLELARG